MDEFSDAPMRKLPWDLRDQAAMSANTGADEGEVGSFVWPEDPDERTLVPFYWSQREYTAIASAIDVGSDIAFSTDAIRVWWLFVQNMRYPVPICDLVTQAILTCEDVQAAIATLIATPGVVQDAVRDLVTTDPAINNYISEVTLATVLTLEQRGQNLLKPDACDPGFTFNQASKFVFLLNQLTEDLFEALEVGTNALERAEGLVSAIPVIGGLLPFDEILQLADDLISNIQEDYMGAYDAGMYDDLRCGLWCTFKDTCLLDIDETLAYYQDKLAESLPQDPLETMRAILSYLVLGDIPGDAPVYAMHLLVIAAMRTGQELFGINFAQLGIRLVAAGDDSDNDWETLCTECVEPSEWIDNNFAGGSQHSWEDQNPGVGFAQWTGSGWERLNDATQIAIKKTIADEITDIEVYFDAPLSGSGGVMWAGSTGLTGLQIGSSADDQLWVWTGVAISGGLGLDMYRPGGYASNQKIVRVRYKLAP
jgi:hypothetical protein